MTGMPGRRQRANARRQRVTSSRISGLLSSGRFFYSEIYANYPIANDRRHLISIIASCALIISIIRTDRWTNVRHGIADGIVLENVSLVPLARFLRHHRSVES